MTVLRTIPLHSPAERLDTDLRDWIVSVEHLPFCDEIIEWNLRVVLVDDRRFNDLDWCLAHAFAHIDLGHEQDGSTEGAPFTAGQEADADGMAKLMLDMEWEDEAEFHELPERE